VPRADDAEPPALSAIKRPDAPSIEVTRHLLQYLLSGHFAPGDRIPSERKLAEALEIGRASVREAIKSLGLLGLVTVRQGDGTYLTQSTSSLLPDVIEWGLLLGGQHIEEAPRSRPGNCGSAWRPCAQPAPTTRPTSRPTSISTRTWPG
jgi:GntR family transcriptional repressor for pyruvate dehydrogenase complex